MCNDTLINDLDIATAGLICAFSENKRIMFDQNKEKKKS